jgi:hypothetical protein
MFYDLQQPCIEKFIKLQKEELFFKESSHKS